MRNNDDLVYNNYSTDKLVAFIKEGHKYVHLNKPELKFTSVTTLIGTYTENKTSESIAKECCANPNSKYYGQDWVELAAAWTKYGTECADKGTELHDYGEQLFNGKFDTIPPDNPKAPHAMAAVKYLFSQGYKLATTEMLVYDDEIAIAGQSDIILKKRIPGTSNEWHYMVYDWKFLSKKLELKSYFNKKYGFKMMSGPFCKLMDCNWIHYSIQLALYQTLTGAPEQVTEKVMIVVMEDGYKLVPAYPMRVFWDQNNELQCVHEIYNGRWWDSRMQQLYKRKPKDIIGI
jgi:hypothetical protein